MRSKQRCNLARLDRLNRSQANSQRLSKFRLASMELSTKRAPFVASADTLIQFFLCRCRLWHISSSDYRSRFQVASQSSSRWGSASKSGIALNPATRGNMCMFLRHECVKHGSGELYGQSWKAVARPQRSRLLESKSQSSGFRIHVRGDFGKLASTTQSKSEALGLPKVSPLLHLLCRFRKKSTLAQDFQPASLKGYSHQNDSFTMRMDMRFQE